MEVSCVWLSSWVGLRIIYIICISAVWSTSRQLTCLQRLYCETSDSGPVKLADAWMGDAIQNYRIPCCQKKKKKRPFWLFVSGLYTGFILTFGTATDYCSHPMVAFSLHARTLVERSTIHSLWALFFLKWRFCLCTLIPLFMSMVQWAEMTVAKCSLTSCFWIGSCTMPGQWHSQPTPTSLGQRCVHV